MTSEKVSAPTMRGLFVRQLIEKIFSGELKAGDRLPSERELAEMSGASRSSVHLGLEDLQRMGFVRIEPRRGVFVVDYAREGNFETFAALTRYAGGLEQPLRVSLVELRNAIYGGGLIRLADCRTAEDLEALRAQRSELEKAAKENAGSAVYARLMRRFETLVTEMSGNMLFPLIMNAFGESCRKLWEKCVSFWGVEAVLRQEQHIIDLIAEGRGHEAARYIEDIFTSYLKANE